MTRELLRYRPANEGYNAWLGRITDLVNATSEALAPSYSLRPPLSRAGDIVHDAPPPPPLRSNDVEPRREAWPRDLPCGALAPVRDEASYQIVQ